MPARQSDITAKTIAAFEWLLFLRNLASIIFGDYISLLCRPSNMLNNIQNITHFIAFKNHHICHI